MGVPTAGADDTVYRDRGINGSAQYKINEIPFVRAMKAGIPRGLAVGTDLSLAGEILHKGVEKLAGRFYDTN